ncbi:MAG: TonB-dependent receptor [Bacteroidales bacterium]|nr:TonB-dependent receptor [Bacteroidales bacterium]
MNKILLFTLLLSILSSYGQKAYVYSTFDEKPIEDVLIFNKQMSASQMSNAHGEFDLEDFNKEDMLTFQHPAYHRFVITYSEFKRNKYKVYLTEKTIELQKFVVSANRWEEKRGEIPNRISMITSKEIEFNNPQTAADLLGQSGEVYIQKSQQGGGSPMLRGFSANSVLLVMDGVRMNNAIFRSGNLQNVILIDPFILESSEVIYGPGTTIYGSDALGGVMSFTSKKPSLSYTKDHVSGNVVMRNSSANNEKTIHVDLNLGFKKFASLSSITYSQFSDLKMGSNGPDEYLRPDYVIIGDTMDYMQTNADPRIQINTGYSQINILQKLRYRPNNYWDFEYNIYFTTSSDNPRYDRLIQYKNDNLKYAEWYYGPQYWIMHSFKAESNKKNFAYDQLKLNLSNQNYEESRHDRKFNNNWLRSRTETVDIYSLNADAKKVINSKGTLYYGLESFINNINSDGFSTDIYNSVTQLESSRYPDSMNFYYAGALYTNYKYKVNDKFIWTAGLRFNKNDLNSRFSSNSSNDFPFDQISLKNNAFNGGMGFSYQMDSTTQFAINLSNGFRAPNLDDVGKIFDSEPGNVVVPNPELKPENLYSIDFGFSRIFNTRVGLEFSAFASFLNNAMVRRDFQFNGLDSIQYDGEMSKVEALVNADHAYILGWSFNAFVNITSHLKYSNNIVVTWGEDSDGMALRHVPPIYGTARLQYNKNKFKSELSLFFNGQLANETNLLYFPFNIKYLGDSEVTNQSRGLAPSEQSKGDLYLTDENGNLYSPSWMVLNFKTSYQVNKNTQLIAGVDNILDVRYRPYSSGIAAPGRNFFISLKARI